MEGLSVESVPKTSPRKSTRKKLDASELLAKILQDIKEANKSKPDPSEKITNSKQRLLSSNYYYNLEPSYLQKKGSNEKILTYKMKPLTLTAMYQNVKRLTDNTEENPFIYMKNYRIAGKKDTIQEAATKLNHDGILKDLKKELYYNPAIPNSELKEQFSEKRKEALKTSPKGKSEMGSIIKSGIKDEKERRKTGNLEVIRHYVKIVNLLDANTKSGKTRGRKDDVSTFDNRMTSIVKSFKDKKVDKIPFYSTTTKKVVNVPYQVYLANIKNKVDRKVPKYLTITVDNIKVPVPLQIPVLNSGLDDAIAYINNVIGKSEKYSEYAGQIASSLNIQKSPSGKYASSQPSKGSSSRSPVRTPVRSPVKSPSKSQSQSQSHSQRLNQNEIKLDSLDELEDKSISSGSDAEPSSTSKSKSKKPKSTSQYK